uniref:Uncharacterized protein n=1 Tax=Anguilla anguilla TaxID=7936 RepID=A0A0E9WYL1_ANGAN
MLRSWTSLWLHLIGLLTCFTRPISEVLRCLTGCSAAHCFKVQVTWILKSSTELLLF